MAQGDTKGRMRHPLRNEWDAYAPRMAAQAMAHGYHGCMARLMLDFMPVLCTALERERDNRTDPKHLLGALTGIIMNLGEQAIKLNVEQSSQRDALRIMMMRFAEDVTRRLAEPGKNGAIILPN